MFWQEDEKKPEITTSDKVVDLSYKIECKQIPGCHAWALSQAMYEALPWIREDESIGIHQIHGATSGNGWERPADDELIHLSKRTRMTLRVPFERVDDAAELVGQTLDVMGYPVVVGKMARKEINPLSTIFARYVMVPDGMSEDQFLYWVVDEFKQCGVAARKMLCGKGHQLDINGDTIETRSLMIADLDKQDSVILQEVGIGPGRHFGCGIFLPHKGIKAVGEAEDTSHFSGA